MISERQLARGFGAFWRECAPGLNAAFLATLRPGGVNEACATLWAEAMPARAPARDNDITAEIAFGMFCAWLEAGEPGVRRIDDALVADVVDAALSRITILRQGPPAAGSAVTPSHLQDAFELADRLLGHLQAQGVKIEPHRRLAGLGQLQACHPDIIQGHTLIEVKMSAASFRSVDLRQLLVYAAMAYAGGLDIRELALVNPRRGVTWRFSAQSLAWQVAGATPRGLYEAIAGFLVEAAPPGDYL